MRTVLLTMLVALSGVCCFAVPPVDTANSVAEDAGREDVTDEDGAAAVSDSSNSTEADFCVPGTSIYRMRLTISGEKVPAGSAEGVAVPIEFSSSALREVVESDWVVWFSDESGVILASETVGFEAQSARLQAWVEWPSLEEETQSAIWFNTGPARIAPEIPTMWANYSGVWHFGTSSRLRDSSPHGNDGTSTTLSLADQADGVVGTAPSFNGDDVILIPDDDSLRMQSFTLMTWVNRRVAQNAALIAKNYPEQGELSFGLGVDADGGLRGWGTPDGTTDLHTFTAQDGEVTLETWYHVAMTRTAGEWVRFYLDGVQVHEQAFTQMIGYDEGELALGTGLYGEPLQGVLDEVMILPAAMSADWIVMSHLAQGQDNLVEVGELEEIELACD